MTKRSDTPSFYERCYQVVRLVPYGKVTTYGAIANYLGNAKSARLVGWAMNHSHGTDIPAHRVVNRVGLLTGKHHFQGRNLMKELLASEGHIFEGDQILNFKDVFWVPTEA